MHITLTTGFQELLHKTDIGGPFASRGCCKSIRSLNEVGLNLLSLCSVSSVAIILETFVTPEIFALSIKLLSFIMLMNFFMSKDD
jgi:hypothetical protein